jgi:hypothetical protein
VLQLVKLSRLELLAAFAAAAIAEALSCSQIPVQAKALQALLPFFPLSSSGGLRLV